MNKEIKPHKYHWDWRTGKSLKSCKKNCYYRYFAEKVESTWSATQIDP